MIAYKTTFNPSSETGTLNCGCGCSIYWGDCTNGFIEMTDWKFCPECGKLKTVEIDENSAALEPVRFEIHEYETLHGTYKKIFRLPDSIRLWQKRLNLRRERVKKNDPSR